MKLPVRILGLVLTLGGFAGAWAMQGIEFTASPAGETPAIAVNTTAKPLQVY